MQPTFLDVISSLFESYILTAILLTVIPALLLAPLCSTLWCFVVFIILLIDSGPRLRFWAQRCRWHNAAIFFLIITMTALWFQLFCLVRFMTGGYPPYGNYLIDATCIASSLSKVLHTLYAGRQGIFRG
ncbi:hypothetical protein GGS24DRAFT_448517 [Hypoxylon argillaceum]|nr:hypothetical protein GGS24DRAFT_448517 [Hypoxylon argillaceum]